MFCLEGAIHCLQAKPYKYRCSSYQAAVTSELANRLFHVLGKDYFMLHKILCGFIIAHSPFNLYSQKILVLKNSPIKPLIFKKQKSICVIFTVATFMGS